MGQHGRLIMDKFINPQVYKVEHVEIDGVMRTGLYFKDSDERDWYETLRTWKAALCTDSNGVVSAYESDVTYMGMEAGRDVYEVDPSTVPENVLGNYKFVNGVFTDIRPSEEQLFERDRSELLAEATQKIAPLQDAVDENVATEEELSKLSAWKLYRIKLNRMKKGDELPPLPTSN